MNTREIIFNELSRWVYNDENQAGDKLQVIDASDFPEITTEIVKKLAIHNVSGSMADKAQMINALTNTMAVNKNKLGCYHSLRDNSLEKLDKLIKSIDI